MIVKEMKRMALCLFLLLFAGSVWSAAKGDRGFCFTSDDLVGKNRTDESSIE